ncbi:MAG: hypothetical protein ACI4PF_06945, partial [Christensenellales bacterium]
MIENGNYVFFDYEKHKDKFKDIFTQMYGEEYKEEISKRLDTVEYIPYIQPEVIYEYYNQILNMHSDEIIHEFKRFMGLRRIPKQMSEILWDESELESPLINCMAEGDNLENMPFLDQINEEQKSKYLETREKGYKLFNLTGDNKFEELQDIVRVLDRAIRLVRKRYSCDVVRDIRRYQENKLTSLQMFLTKLSKSSFPFTDKDRELLAKPDFDFVDVTNLDCNHILFNRNVGNPGIIYYFNSECQQTCLNGTNLDAIEEILRGRLQYWALNIEDGCDNFSYVTQEEVFGKEKPRDRADFIKRMERQLNEMATSYPEYNFTLELADNVETLRKYYADGIYSGCKFVKNINKDYQNTVHNPFENSWVTYLDNQSNIMGSPV